MNDCENQSLQFCEGVDTVKTFDPKPGNNFIDGPGHGSFIEEPIYDPLVAVKKFKEGIHHGRKHVVKMKNDRNEKTQEMRLDDVLKLISNKRKKQNNPKKKRSK